MSALRNGLPLFALGRIVATPGVLDVSDLDYRVARLFRHVYDD